MIAHSVAKPLLLALALGSFSMTGSARAELVRIYVTNSAGDSVHVVDPGTNKVVQVFKDLRDVGVSILTLGQYLRPSNDHAVMTRYYHPDEFKELKRIALGLGFAHVEAGPLVRSSYHAHEQADAADAALAASR